ncbi:uncharacterized protein LOC116176175 [Photinus pyralis]|uniref:uncharacterized protein LOC116176175 n=1 Tax=Photinus pyralis TaxID=7054 RepID=UPI0012677366|nr:uncharacterized protein LOC116176175 [Photinus pyralis]
MEWSNDDCLQLIDLYEQHPVLWDAKHPFHYSKNKKIDAWDSIAQNLNKELNGIKQKMTSLLGSFRAQKSKGKKTIGTGKARQDVYISKWFAFERMQFLLDKDEPRETIDTEDGTLDEDTSSQLDANTDGTEIPLEPQDTEDALVVINTAVVENTEPPRPKKLKKPKEKEDVRIQEAYAILKDTHAKYSASQNVSTDRFTIFGQHIAAKLRTYNKRTQAIVEHSINNILFEADMGNIESTYPPVINYNTSSGSTPVLSPSPHQTYPESEPSYNTETVNMCCSVGPSSSSSTNAYSFRVL